MAIFINRLALHTQQELFSFFCYPSFRTFPSRFAKSCRVAEYNCGGSARIRKKVGLNPPQLSAVFRFQLRPYPPPIGRAGVVLLSAACSFVLEPVDRLSSDE